MISPRALDGPRWHRLAVGAMLFLAMGGVGVGLLVATFGAGASPLARTGLGAGAVSMLAVAWWCARYWYAASSEGRRAEPVPEPDAWPWALPWTVGTVSLLATGVRQVRAGDSAGWFTLGFGGLIGLPLTVLFLLMLYFTARGSLRTGSRPRGGAPRASAEAPRPRRDWGPIG
ncbi:hypothetical protein [Streptomyces sp. KN37]|uniref:hypothetical protein n=1 Tax=Streptomyces sp. KN37 TaxID=3090667 RepID=UPI002A749185|nr:hypothetical protein [Streptomyces sp. KN37]WPO72130.1 hypothetical protein R9806_16555 [Streptomyces sp. KN37]